MTLVRPSLAALKLRLPSSPLTRFAPSPTGYLHIGHVVNAIYVWGMARALDGRVLLRFEDHDRERCRPAFEQAILDDLDWLGFEPQIGPTASFRQGPSPHRQSDVTFLFQSANARLAGEGLVYVCGCSRKMLPPAASPAAERRYPGTCRSRGLIDAPGSGLRVVMSPGPELFDDGLLGQQVQDPSVQCGDMLIRERHGFWTYQFCVVVNDTHDGVDLVIRGYDLLASTGRQIRLARLLGRPRPPVFLHHPILAKDDGRKLSKSNRDTGIRELRAAGHSAADVIGMAAHAAGLQPTPAGRAAREVSGLFLE